VTKTCKQVLTIGVGTAHNRLLGRYIVFYKLSKSCKAKISKLELPVYQENVVRLNVGVPSTDVSDRCSSYHQCNVPTIDLLQALAAFNGHLMHSPNRFRDLKQGLPKSYNFFRAYWREVSHVCAVFIKIHFTVFKKQIVRLLMVAIVRKAAKTLDNRRIVVVSEACKCYFFPFVDVFGFC
jgi:hypothetical protein